jgi:hypothetical protein
VCVYAYMSRVCCVDVFSHTACLCVHKYRHAAYVYSFCIYVPSHVDIRAFSSLRHVHARICTHVIAVCEATKGTVKTCTMCIICTHTHTHASHQDTYKPVYAHCHSCTTYINTQIRRGGRSAASAARQDHCRGGPVENQRVRLHATI